MQERIERKLVRFAQEGDRVHSAVRNGKLVFFVKIAGKKTIRVIIPHDTLIEDGTGKGRLVEITDPENPKISHFGIFDTKFRGERRRGVWFFESTDHEFTVLQLPS